MNKFDRARNRAMTGICQICGHDVNYHRFLKTCPPGRCAADGPDGKMCFCNAYVARKEAQFAHLLLNPIPTDERQKTNPTHRSAKSIPAFENLDNEVFE